MDWLQVVEKSLQVHRHRDDAGGRRERRSSAMRRPICTHARSGWIVGLASVMLVEGVALAQGASPPAEAAPAAATSAAPQPAPSPAAAPAPGEPPPTGAPPSVDARIPFAPTPPPAPAPAAEPVAEPFAFGDFTWLNGTNRQHSAILDSPLFTGSVLLDVNYTQSKNNPIDNTVVGSTALSRNHELTLAFMGFGGDLHYQNARLRIMMQYGLRATLVPRNDYSSFRGQFDLQDALRYISEAYGGYHWDAMHGINLDGGIFMSYVGLFSYDNFENWMYLPSFTSDNTPWFFNGFRLQLFPSDKLKIEPWLINGWQTYGTFNEMPGFGFQILWRPMEVFSVLSNGYVGWDNQDAPGQWRYHSDNSAELRYFQNASSSFITRAATSITVDIGGEGGDGVTPFGGQNHPQSMANQYTCATKNLGPLDRPCTAQFLSWMIYNRVWFSDKFAWNVGGGWMHNPSRYLVLDPSGQASPIPQPGSIQGIAYIPPSNPYYTAYGSQFDAFDYETGIQYMPVEQVTYDLEFNHRQASVPYFAGHGGVTSPDGYITTSIPNGWRADLSKNDSRVVFALLVRF
jgi:hypothetical protein